MNRKPPFAAPTAPPQGRREATLRRLEEALRGTPQLTLAGSPEAGRDPYNAQGRSGRDIWDARARR